MAEDRQFAFGLFRFDPRTGQLWREHSEVKLNPRAAAVLHLLAERAEDLVTKQELERRRAHVLYPGVAQRARRRCPASAHD